MSETQDPFMPMNPETAFHASSLREKRQKSRRSAIVTFACSIISLGGIASLLIGSFLSGIALPLLTIVLYFAILLACIAGVVSGTVAFRASMKPITAPEVEEVRRQSRSELMRLAQGHIPFIYRRSAIIIECIFGCSWVFFGITLFLIPATLSPWLNSVLGGMFLLGAACFLSDAFITRPRVAKRLAARSSRELADRLTLGEVTEGHSEET